jgi:hypothetical protein
VVLAATPKKIDKQNCQTTPKTGTNFGKKIPTDVYQCSMGVIN